MSQSLGHSLPIELVREIMTWITQFQQAELADRIASFKSSYGPQWSTIIGDVRMNVPRYTAQVTGTAGTRFFVSVYSPDCDPNQWSSTIHHRMIRRALSVHREFLTDNVVTRNQYSILDVTNSVVNPPPE
jgi:hypothetical protein